jgi:hypothetical protein
MWILTILVVQFTCVIGRSTNEMLEGYPSNEVLSEEVKSTAPALSRLKIVSLLLVNCMTHGNLLNFS